MQKRSKRYAFFEALEVNQDTYLDEMPDIGLMTQNAPLDPAPGIRIQNGNIVEMDGKPLADFDLIDHFIARYAVDVTTAAAAMQLDSTQFARMMLDINVPRKDVVRLAKGMTPAKIVDVVRRLNPVELMMAGQKMRTRKTPANQAHVCNKKDDPALLAADAAFAALAGFAELETTVGVSRHAYSNALGLLIGSQIGRPGTLSQCACEEALELAIGMKGFTTYAETLSVYGTDAVFRDGDDTPWSKMFLSAAYLSRGLKNRFTSGSGAEVLMGKAEGKSMLYLEARCLAIVRGAGVQGVQNGGIDCTPISAALPGGQQSVMAENLIAMLWDLECATGNDTPWSGSTVRGVAHLLPWMITGADFIHSGFGATTVEDNMFGGSGFNIENLDEEIAIQRDFRIDCGLTSVTEEAVVEVRTRAATIMQKLCEALDFPPYTDEQIEKVIYAHDSNDIERDLGDNLKMSEEIKKRRLSIVDVIRACVGIGESEMAESLLDLLKQRIAGDYLQTAAVFDRFLNCMSAINDPNDYTGPGTGYRIGKQRWEEIKAIRSARRYADVKRAQQRVPVKEDAKKMTLIDGQKAIKGTQPGEVVIGLSPAFGRTINTTLSGLYVGEALYEILAGIEEEGGTARIVRVENTADLGFIGLSAARLSGSGIGIGLQAKGTTILHQKDLPPLDNLELFPMAMLVGRDMYRRIGRNAAVYAQGGQPRTIPTVWDQQILKKRARAEPMVVVLQHLEEECIRADKWCTEVNVRFQ